MCLLTEVVGNEDCGFWLCVCCTCARVEHFTRGIERDQYLFQHTYTGREYHIKIKASKKIQASP